ncbi:threonine synthase [Salibacterium aidingense]|uniref:threonine synthase n=1 Tax=Salibacterium aidingense TaxID=384933 RepID=UPI0006886DDF
MSFLDRERRECLVFQAFSYLSHLYCPTCSQEYSAKEPAHLCQCGSPLLAAYDMDALKVQFRKETVMARPPSLWRYHELLPVKKENDIVSLGEGMTPLVEMIKTGKNYGVDHLFMKDESLLPSGSSKARGAAAGISKAKEWKITDIAMPANGNAGAAWSLYGSRASITSHIVMPVEAPIISRKECAAAGADLHLVNGLIHDAGTIISHAVQKYGWFDASPFKEPYRIEGKKTMGLELAEQLQWKLPDVIACPVGEGAEFIGIYKAMQELMELGWVDSEKIPRLVAVQAESCAPIVEAYEKHQTTADNHPESYTAAFDINVPASIGDFLVLNAIYETKGCAVAVCEHDLLAEQRWITRKEGTFISPEGAAAFAGVRRLREEAWLHPEDTVVCVNTGMGIKSPEAFDVSVPILAADDEL